MLLIGKHEGPIGNYATVAFAERPERIIQWVQPDMKLDHDLQFSWAPARYAKDKFALMPVQGQDGWKSTAAAILTMEVSPRARWSKRERAYIVSRAQFGKFVDAIKQTQLSRNGRKGGDTCLT